MTSPLTDLEVRAALRDELSGPLDELRRKIGATGEAAQDAGAKAGRGARGFDVMAGGVGRLARTAGKAGLYGALGVAAVGVTGLVKVLSTGAGEVSDWSAGMAQLAAGLKSTNGVSKTSVTQLGNLASEIEAYSGQTDDSIVATEKLLLTFTGIRNEAGKGNDVFTQTTKIAADMAARMGGDASQSAVQLGKALNDPTKGIAALSRVGVVFDAQQTKQIKTLQKSGDTLGAQKVILAELNKEFGGSAAAAGQSLPGILERLKRKYEGVSQTVATALLPAFQAALPYIERGMDSAGAAVERGVAKLDGLVATGRSVYAVFQNSGLDNAVGQLDTMSGAGGKLERAFHSLKPVVDDVVTVVRDALAPAISDAASAIQPAWLTPLGLARAALGILADHTTTAHVALTGIVVALTAAKVASLAGAIATGISTAATTAQSAAAFVATARTYGLSYALKAGGVASKALAVSTWLVNAAMNANPVTLIVIGLAALAAGLIFAYKHSEKFRDIVKGAFSVVLGAVDGLLFGIEAVLRALGHIPGFGWAKTAANAVEGLRDKLQGVRDSLAGIPTYKEVVIEAKLAGTQAAQQVLKAGGSAAQAQDVNNSVAKRTRLGDTATSHARGFGDLGGTLAAHAATVAASGARPTITNALVGGGGRGAGSGDHQAGRALDLVGSGLGSYARVTRQAGGYAAFHGSGRTRHLHAVPAPIGDTRRSMARRPASSRSSGGTTLELAPAVTIGPGAIVVQGLTAQEAARAVADGIERYVRDRRERA